MSKVNWGVLGTAGIAKGQTIRNDFDAEPVLHLPLVFEGNEALVDISGNVGVYVQAELFNTELVDQKVDFAFQFIGKEYAGLYDACPET